MVTKSERFWVSHRNALGVTLLANLPLVNLGQV